MATVKRNSADDSPEKGIIIQNLTIRPVARQSQDIEKWRNAIRAAEGIIQHRVPLYDLFEEVMLDGLLTSVSEKRVLGVTKTKLLFVDKEGKEVEAMKDLLKLGQFRELRKEVQRQKAWGIKVIELINDAQGFRIFSVPVKHIRPKEGKIVYEQNGTDGIFYKTAPANKYIFEVGKWNDFGLLMKAAQYVIYKRGGFGDWAQFAEIFGMPFREMNYDGYNEQLRQQLIIALEQAGSASYIVKPKDAELKLHEARNAQSNGELFNTLRKACNEELSILFLGQTETTSKTAGSLGGNDDTHEQTEDDINHDDLADELSIFNEKVKPILANLGFPVDGGEFAHEVKEEKLTKKDQVTMVLQVKDKGLPVDDDYLYELTGIPKPANYDQQKAEIQKQQEQQQQQGAPPKPGKGPKGKDKAGNKKLSISERVGLAMADFFDHAPKG